MKKKIITAIFVLYLLSLFMITVFRPWRGAYSFMQGTINPRLFVDYGSIFQNDIPMFIYLFVGNIVWFVPLGFYIVKYRGKSLLRAIFLGFCLSLTIEVFQYVFGTGISEIDDLVFNTFGSLLGAFAGRMLIRLRREDIYGD